MEDKDSVEKLNEVIEEMEETEKDIANKKLRNVSLNRQKEILTKLLELDDALRKQGDDDARESKTNESLYEKILIEELKKLEIEKLKQTEMLKTQPVSYTHLRAHETSLHLVCRLLLEKKKQRIE